MTLHLRFAGQKESAIVLTDIEYVEPLPGLIQYTQTLPDGSVSDVQTIPIDAANENSFIYQDVAYDFLAVYS